EPSYISPSELEVGSNNIGSNVSGEIISSNEQEKEIIEVPLSEPTVAELEVTDEILTSDKSGFAPPIVPGLVQVGESPEQIIQETEEVVEIPGSQSAVEELEERREIFSSEEPGFGPPLVPKQIQ